jgi:hypothetical protein
MHANTALNISVARTTRWHSTRTHPANHHSRGIVPMSGDKQDYNLKVEASSRIVLPADGDSTSSNGAPAG